MPLGLDANSMHCALTLLPSLIKDWFVRLFSLISLSLSLPPPPFSFLVILENNHRKSNIKPQLQFSAQMNPPPKCLCTNLSEKRLMVQVGHPSNNSCSAYLDKFPNQTITAEQNLSTSVTSNRGSGLMTTASDVTMT